MKDIPLFAQILAHFRFVCQRVTKSRPSYLFSKKVKNISKNNVCIAVDNILDT